MWGGKNVSSGLARHHLAQQVPHWELHLKTSLAKVEMVAECFQLPDVFCLTCSMISILNAFHGPWTHRSAHSSF